MEFRVERQCWWPGKGNEGRGTGVTEKESEEHISSLARNFMGWGLGNFWHLKRCQGLWLVVISPWRWGCSCCCALDSKNALRFAIAAARFASTCRCCSSVSSICQYWACSRMSEFDFILFELKRRAQFLDLN